MTEELKDDIQVDETQVASDGTYTFQLVSYYKEVTMGNILLEIMVTRNGVIRIYRKDGAVYIPVYGSILRLIKCTSQRESEMLE